MAKEISYENVPLTVIVEGGYVKLFGLVADANGESKPVHLATLSASSAMTLGGEFISASLKVLEEKNKAVPPGKVYLPYQGRG